jgi:prepilin-type N-terminal cleavage/methylation domain-containing protein
MKRQTELLSPRRPRAAKPLSRGGFSLLEVLAAVAILGIWFVVLASVAVQGLRAEGSNERRIRASLAADAALAEIEMKLGRGELPEDQESERGDFLVSVTSVPIVNAELGPSDADLVGLLTSELAALNDVLFSIEVRVTWTEGTREESVTRTTYAWDADLLFEALGADLPPPTGDGGQRPRASL